MRVSAGDTDRETVIRFRCRNRAIAWGALALFKENLIPPGHVVDLEQVDSGRGPARPRPGRRVNVTIVLFHNDNRQLAIVPEHLERELKVLDVA